MSFDLAGIFGAGLLTFVTPCVLPLIPVYLAILLGGAGDGGRGRLSLFVNTLLFALGLSVVFVLMGLTATWAGALLGTYKVTLTLLGGLLIFLFGLKMLGVLRVSFLDREKRVNDAGLQTRFHPLNALVMGVVFSLGWTPCVGPILGSVLTYTASRASSAGAGALYLATYAAGFVLPLLVLSLFGDGARRLLGRLGRWLPRIEKAGGALLAGVGLFLMLDVTSTPSGAAAPPAAGAAPAVASAPRPATSIGQPSERPRVVQFTSPDCPICRQMIPTVGIIERECGGKQVDVIKVDVTRPGNRQLAAAYGVRGVPTFVFLDRGGEQVARLVGSQSLGALRQSLATLVGEQCAGVGLFQPEAPSPGLESTPSCSTSSQDPTRPVESGASCGS